VLLSLARDGSVNALCEFGGLEAPLGEIKDVAKDRNGSDGIHAVDMSFIRSGTAAGEEDPESP
jgi:hypothetical protein